MDALKRAVLLMLGGCCLAVAARAQTEPDALMAQELLELVLTHCRDGRAQQARRLAQDIQEQLPTTAAIQALLAPILKGACAPSGTGAQRELHLTMGWDDNVNLGVLASSVTFTTPAQPLTFLLDSSYQPVRSAYLGVTGQYQTQTAQGWTVQTQAGARQLVDYSPLNTLGLQIMGLRDVAMAGLPGQLAVGWAETLLDGRHFRSAPSLAWRSQPSRGREGWVFNIGAQHHDYSSNTFDARLLQAGVAHQTRTDARTRISWGLGLLHDQALGTRAGGDRTGMNLQLGWQQATQDGVWHAQWARQSWRSAQDFLPGLMDYRRSNRTVTALVGYQKPLASGGVGYIEYQYRSSQDNVPLYVYRSNQLAVGWMLRWP